MTCDLAQPRAAASCVTQHDLDRATTTPPTSPTTRRGAATAADPRRRSRPPTASSFFSPHARARRAARGARRRRARAASCRLGTDHRVSVAAAGARRRRAVPTGSTAARSCSASGTDFLHKNRLVRDSRCSSAATSDHGWDGRLVLAGPHVAGGSSSARGGGWSWPPTRAGRRVCGRCAAVSEAEKRGCIDRAAPCSTRRRPRASASSRSRRPSTGVPCLYAAGTSLAELLPRGRRRSCRGTPRPARTPPSACSRRGRAPAHLRAVRAPGPR